MSACGHSTRRRAARERDAAPRARRRRAVRVEPADETERRTRIERLKRLLGERIVLLDGAMGTMIQQHRLDEATSGASGFARTAATCAATTTS